MRNGAGFTASVSASGHPQPRRVGGALLRTTDAGRHWKPVPGTARIEEVFWLGFTTGRVGAAIVHGCLTTRSSGGRRTRRNLVFRAHSLTRSGGFTSHLTVKRRDEPPERGRVNRPRAG